MIWKDRSNFTRFKRENPRDEPVPNPRDEPVPNPRDEPVPNPRDSWGRKSASFRMGIPHSPLSIFLKHLEDKWHKVKAASVFANIFHRGDVRLLLLLEFVFCKVESLHILFSEEKSCVVKKLE
jgi:hypothetical protein